MAEHPRVGVSTVGVRLPLGERYTHAPALAFEQLPLHMARWDIGIAPLLDTPFNRARSDIKVKEYAASQLPWLASAVGPYRGLGAAQGGQVVDNEQWFDALDALVRDDAGRRQLSLSGARWAATQTITSLASRYEEAFADAAERASGTRPETGARSLATPSARPRLTARLPASMLRPGRAS